MPSIKNKPTIIKKIPFDFIIVIVVVGLIVIAAKTSLIKFSIGTPGATPLPSPTPIIRNTKWDPIPSTQVMFASQVFLKRNKTYVSVPLRFPKQFEETWLILTSVNNNKPWKWLIYHPQLTNLNWNSINDGTVYLYQKHPTYQKITDLLINPPSPDKLLTDDCTANLESFKLLKSTPLSLETKLDDYDYILTTYKPSLIEGTDLYYSNIVDATNGTVANTNLSWSIQVLNATEENMYYLGEIHIDYRQY